MAHNGGELSNDIGTDMNLPQRYKGRDALSPVCPSVGGRLCRNGDCIRLRVTTADRARTEDAAYGLSRKSDVSDLS